APPPSMPAVAPSPGDVPAPPPQVLVPAQNAAPPSVVGVGPRRVLETTGSIFKLGDATLVGREDPSLQIDFDGYTDGQYVSHRHAQIVKHDGAFYLEDLGSANRTRVNGAKLSAGQSQLLHEGDKVRFGKIEVTFHES
ncbi:MAG: FHA domain-containing protein, partial [Aggregatilineales bacterium]